MDKENRIRDLNTLLASLAKLIEAITDTHDVSLLADLACSVASELAGLLGVTQGAKP